MASEELELKTDALRSKRITLIRHAQSEYNKAVREVWRCGCLFDPMTFDAPLSEYGREQAAQAHASGKYDSIAADVEVIITSPLTRAIETTLALFPDTKTPIEVCALHRERMETSGDVGTPPEELKEKFPSLNFSNLPKVWWYSPNKGDIKAISREPLPELERRLAAFRAMLQARPETRIAVVGHSHFFKRFLGSFFKLPNCGCITIDLPVPDNNTGRDATSADSTTPLARQPRGQTAQ